MSQTYVIKSVIKEIYSLPGFRNFKVLDLSCGEGEIIKELASEGCEVEGTHYKDDDYVLKNPRKILKEAKIYKNVDLDKTLPFNDGSYDLVIATEILEHLPSHFRIIPEVARILKTNGYFIFTTPNIHRLHSRLKFFLTGTHKLIRRRIGWDLTYADLYAYHINPVDFPVLHTLLSLSNIKIEKISFTYFKLKHSYLLLLYPIVLLYTFLETRANKKAKYMFRKGEEDLFRWLIHPALLSSEQLLIVAKKSIEQHDGANRKML